MIMEATALAYQDISWDYVQEKEYIKLMENNSFCLSMPENKTVYMLSQTPIRKKNSDQKYIYLSNIFCGDYERTAETQRKLSRLEGFLSLEKGWDGCEAWPLDRFAYYHMKEVIENMDGKRLAQWNLFPSLNGSVALTARKKINAIIYIGPDNFTYSAMNNDRQFIGEKKPYSLNAVKEAIEKIYNLLKNEFQA